MNSSWGWSRGGTATTGHRSTAVAASTELGEDGAVATVGFQWSTLGGARSSRGRRGGQAGLPSRVYPGSSGSSETTRDFGPGLRRRGAGHRCRHPRSETNHLQTEGCVLLRQPGAVLSALGPGSCPRAGEPGHLWELCPVPPGHRPRRAGLWALQGATQGRGQHWQRPVLGSTLVWGTVVQVKWESCSRGDALWNDPP